MPTCAVAELVALCRNGSLMLQLSSVPGCENNMTILDFEPVKCRLVAGICHAVINEKLSLINAKIEEFTGIIYWSAL